MICGRAESDLNQIHPAALVIANGFLSAGSTQGRKTVIQSFRRRNAHV